MGKKSDISRIKIDMVKGLLDADNISQREITKRVKVSKTTVANVKKKMDLLLPLKPQREGKCGRKHSITPRGKRILKKIVLEDRRLTNEQIKNKLQESGVNVSTRTVRRDLKEFGFESRRPVKKPKLTEKMMKKRLQWCRKYKDFTEDDWMKIHSYGFSVLTKYILYFTFPGLF